MDRLQSWRRNRRRGVSPIIATILLVAITVVLAAVLYILISGLTKGPNGESVGGSLAIGSAIEAQKGANYYYNFTVEAAGSGITWNSVDLQITNNAGLVSSGITSYTVYNIAFSSICQSNGATETSWAAGSSGTGATQISSTHTLVVIATVNLANTGAQLNALGVGSFSGTIHAKIP
ncbi:MAG TPA: archaellin/type IV pilin N-terminal domain-containing protein [Thermoplasmata archaeon]|nr:archaellin/type IV pilin N-terminal domain-containing protein [Thermoplasmata archaeon]